MNTTTHPDYHELIDQLTDAFGTAPSQPLTLELEQLYARHPAVTKAKAREATDAHAAGRIHSPWGFLQAEMRRHDTARQSIPQASDRERDHEIQLATTWLRNAGLFVPSIDEVLDELFGTHGRLKAWAEDTELRQRMTDLWQTQQPRAEATTQASHSRAEAWKTHRRTIEEAKRPTTPPLEPTPEAEPIQTTPEPQPPIQIQEPTDAIDDDVPL